jgi:hypothetical protein
VRSRSLRTEEEKPRPDGLLCRIYGHLVAAYMSSTESWRLRFANCQHNLSKVHGAWFRRSNNVWDCRFSKGSIYAPPQLFAMRRVVLTGKVCARIRGSRDDSVRAD